MSSATALGFYVSKWEAHVTGLEWNEGRLPGGSGFFAYLSTYTIPLDWVGYGFPILSVFKGVVPLDVLPGAWPPLLLGKAAPTWEKPTPEKTSPLPPLQLLLDPLWRRPELHLGILPPKQAKMCKTEGLLN